MSPRHDDVRQAVAADAARPADGDVLQVTVAFLSGRTVAFRRCRSTRPRDSARRTWS
ncbi:hypothetical protein NKH77_31845 [Streptomyces sp. M19]